MSGEDVGDPSTVLRSPSQPPGPAGPAPISQLPTRQAAPDRGRTPQSLESSPYLSMDENVDDPSTVIRDPTSPRLAGLPADFDAEVGNQERTVIQKDFGPSILHVQETREMAPPRDDAPLGAQETTVVAPNPADVKPLWRRWWLTAASLSAVAAVGLTVLFGVSAFLGGTRAMSALAGSLVATTPEARCEANVNVGRDFVNEAKIRPRREALSILDDLQADCVAGRVGVWGTVLVIVEMRNRASDGLLQEYELQKVAEALRQWSQ